MADHLLVGKAALVTGRVAPGEVGEVMVRVRGGSEDFLAYPADGQEVIPSGCRVVIVDYLGDRRVTVSRL